MTTVLPPLPLATFHILLALVERELHASRVTDFNVRYGSSGRADGAATPGIR